MPEGFVSFYDQCLSFFYAMSNDENVVKTSLKSNSVQETNNILYDKDNLTNVLVNKYPLKVWSHIQSRRNASEHIMVL